MSESRFIQCSGLEMYREKVTKVAHGGAVRCCVEAMFLLELHAMFVQV